MSTLDWNDFFDDFSDDSQIVNSEQQALSPKEERDKEYTELVRAYKDYYTKKSSSNIVLRIIFFAVSLFILAGLIGGCIAIAIIVCLSDTDRVTFLTSIISSILGAVTSILVLPTIICNYLFPKDEDKYIRDLICHFKDSDDKD